MTTPHPSLEELKALLEAATPGPWLRGRGTVEEARGTHTPVQTHDADVPALCWHEADAQLIAALRNAAPDLIQELEALRLVKDAAQMVEPYIDAIFDEIHERGCAPEPFHVWTHFKQTLNEEAESEAVHCDCPTGRDDLLATHSEDCALALMTAGFSKRALNQTTATKGED